MVFLHSEQLTVILRERTHQKKFEFKVEFKFDFPSVSHPGIKVPVKVVKFGGLFYYQGIMRLQ